MGREALVLAARGGGYSWSMFLQRLRHGEPDAFLMAIAVGVGITVALWAGTNMMKKETRR